MNPHTIPALFLLQPFSIGYAAEFEGPEGAWIFIDTIELLVSAAVAEPETIDVASVYFEANTIAFWFFQVTVPEQPSEPFVVSPLNYCFPPGTTFNVSVNAGPNVVAFNGNVLIHGRLSTGAAYTGIFEP